MTEQTTAPAKATTRAPRKTGNPVTDRKPATAKPTPAKSTTAKPAAAKPAAASPATPAEAVNVVVAKLAKPPTENEIANWEWACAQSGVKFDQAAFVAGRRLQGPWQEYNRSRK